MPQRRQKLPLFQETVTQARAMLAGSQQLHGDFLLHFAVGALGQIDGSHAARTEQPVQPVGSAAAESSRVFRTQCPQRGSADAAREVAVFAPESNLQQRLDLGTQLGPGAEFLEKLVRELPDSGSTSR